MGIKTPDLLKLIDIPRQKLYYLEQKGYITPQKIVIGEKEFRQYSEEDVKRITCIWGYLKKGFKYKIAYEKATEELSNPQMDLIKIENSTKEKEEER
ncbi:MAG: MerR family transcriptional regulator [Deltaproteobacteria bacterium]|nr:MerR family transcriptional regulator [Deltaproteobacteria bacterium]MBI5893192.1 MerR family transcriptional regulator [Deltaproteobacteria bacterium]